MNKNISISFIAIFFLFFVSQASPLEKLNDVLVSSHVCEWFIGPQKNACTFHIPFLMYSAFLSKQKKVMSQRIELNNKSTRGTRTPTSFTLQASSTAGSVTFDPSSYALTLLASSAGTVSFSPNSGTISMDQSLTAASTPSFTGLSLSNQGGLLFYEATGGTNKITMQSPALASDYTLTLPTTAGTDGYAMTTDGFGNLSWSAFTTESFFANGGNAFSAIATLGTTDAYALNVVTGGASNTRLSISSTGDVSIYDKLVTINKGGAASSAIGAGFEIEENSSITGYAKTSSDRKSWEFLAPAQAYTATISPIGSSFLLKSISTSSFFAGQNAGSAATSATDCVGFGYGALTAITTGTQNTAFGANALSKNTTQSYNTAYGFNSLVNLFSATGGEAEENTAFGHRTGEALTTGGKNVFVGGASAFGVKTGVNNTCLGYIAGSNYSSSESNNICIGSSVGGTVAESNVIRIGSGTTAAYIAGIYGVSVGSSGNLVGINSSTQFGTTLTTPATQVWSLGGNLNLASSSPVIYDNSTTVPLLHHTGGVTNMFVGSAAGNTSVTGTNCAGFGYQALKALTTGVQNTAFGSNALSKITTQSYNTAYGYNSLLNLYSSTSGEAEENTALGHRTGEVLTTGGKNVFVGGASGYQMTTGSNNACLGYLAGSSYTTNAESNNICIGSSVGGTAAESNVIRVGNTSNAKTYITGIYEKSPSSYGNLIGIDSNHQLGTSATTWSAVCTNLQIGSSSGDYAVSAPLGSSATPLLQYAYVNSSGSLNYGSYSMSSTRTATGIYSVSYGATYSSTPAIVANTVTAVGILYFAVASTLGVSSAEIRIFSKSSGALVNADFCVTIIGV